MNSYFHASHGNSTREPKLSVAIKPFPVSERSLEIFFSDQFTSENDADLNLLWRAASPDIWFPESPMMPRDTSEIRGLISCDVACVIYYVVSHRHYVYRWISRSSLSRTKHANRIGTSRLSARGVRYCASLPRVHPPIIARVGRPDDILVRSDDA